MTPACIADGTAPCLVNDPGGVELGVKFQTSKPINILGVRFYRADDGTWSGSLWDADSTFITQATDSTSGAGWQTAMFSSPQPMGTGDTFIASYFAPGGQYAFDWDYFTGGGHTAGPVTALGGAGVNGLFTYSLSSAFPTTTFRDTNYWVTPLWVELYDFTGFFQPIENEMWNKGKAGSAIPVKFSLGGDQGLDIFQEGYPKAIPIACPSGSTPTDLIEETATAGGSSLQYDVTLDQYTYVWKTSKAWATKCYRFELGLNDLTSHTFDVQFAK